MAAVGVLADLAATAGATATATVAARLRAGGADEVAVAAAVAPVAAALDAYWAAALVDVRRSLRLALPHELPVGTLGWLSEGGLVVDG